MILAVTDQGRIFSESVVSWCVHVLMHHVHSNVDEKLYQSYSVAKVIFKSLPLSLRHLQDDSRDKEEHKGGIQKAEVVHKLEGENIFKNTI